MVRRLPASVVQAPASERACLPTSKLSVLSPHRTPSGRSGFVHDNPDSKRATREIVMALQRLRNEMQGLRYILFDETNYKNTDLSRFGPVYPKLPHRCDDRELATRKQLLSRSPPLMTLPIDFSTYETE